MDLAGKGKGYGAKGSEASKVFQEKAKGLGKQGATFATLAASRGRKTSPSEAAPVAPSLDELKTALQESFRALGADHVVTRVIREEYEAAAHQKFCGAASTSSQLDAARAQLYWSERDMKLHKEAMAVTSEALQRKLVERNRQISEEMELQEKLRWQKAEVSAISEMLNTERTKQNRPSSSVSSRASGAGIPVIGRLPVVPLLGRPEGIRSRSPNRPGDGKGRECGQRQRPAHSGGPSIKKEQPDSAQWS